MSDSASLIKLVFEGLIQENIALKKDLKKAEEQLKEYRNIENTFRETFMEALQIGEDYKINAKREAELIIKEAELKTKKIINNQPDN